MAITDPFIGTDFDGRYRIEKKLGSGGMANVYLAEDLELGRSVAIKILDERHASDDQFVERFLREAKTAAGLSHTNIVSIYARGEADGTYYIAMEYLDGRTLKELISERGPTPPKVAIGYARQILAAVGFAHKHGVVHRDIKPHNVLVDRENHLKVTDFGIARSGASQMTEVGSIIGTAQYLSPEQARGAPVGPGSDIYSVGVVLYEMLTGEVPFTGDTPLEIAMKHLSAIPDPPSKRNPAVPRDLDLIVLRALAKNPRNRYQSAEEMDADLERVGRGLAVSDATENAATMVLAGTAGMDSAPTAVTRTTGLEPIPTRAPVRPVPTAGYFPYEEPPRRRAVWPWVLAALLIVAAVAGGWFAYKKIQQQLEANKPVPVPNVVGVKQNLAVQKIEEAGLTPKVQKGADKDVAAGVVISQAPEAGDRIDKGNTVVLHVSTGTPRVDVPDVRGKTESDAIATLADASLKTVTKAIFSDATPGTVTAQDPKPGTRVPEDTVVHINISEGLKPVTVPSVITEGFDQASAELAGQGFKVGRSDVENSQPAGIVIAQDPGGGTQQPPGTTVTLTVSKGPSSTLVPSVTSLDEQTATDTLTTAGFKVNSNSQNVPDVSQDGIVLRQNPLGGASARPGATVTIVVGRFSGAPPATTPTDTTPTEPTDTTPGGQ